MGSRHWLYTGRDGVEWDGMGWNETGRVGLDLDRMAWIYPGRDGLDLDGMAWIYQTLHSAAQPAVVCLAVTQAVVAWTWMGWFGSRRHGLACTWSASLRFS